MKCKHCKGRGYFPLPNNEKVTCGMCNGKGTITISVNPKDN